MKFAAVVVAVMLPVCAFAQDPTSLFAQLQSLHANVMDEAADTAFVIPLAGSLQGANGTFFRSDLTLVNNRSRNQTIVVSYYPTNGSCSAAKVQKLTFTPNSSSGWQDFVSSVLSTSGLGSLVVVATDTTGTVPDSTASIDGFSRIWTPVPGFNGTGSQSFPGLALSSDSSAKQMFGLKQNLSFRTNVAIFNYLPTGPSSPRTFNVKVTGTTQLTNTFTMTVQPCSVSQQAIPGGDYGNVTIRISPTDSLGNWYAVGSTVDNQSADSWNVVGRPDTVRQ